MEYSTPKDGHAREMMREASPEREPVIPLFPLLEEKEDRRKKKEEPGTSQLIGEETLEPRLPDPLLFSLDSKG